ncbi:MAG: type II secretion system F family protein [Armatimonadota bacterium]
MGLYSYTAKRDGAVISDTTTAASLPEAIRRLQDRGLKPQEVAPVQEDTRDRGFGESERVWLYRHLAELLQAGIPLHEALDAAADDMSSPNAAQVVRDMAGLVASRGLTFAEAMERYPKIFGSGSVAVVRAAEKAGRLQQSLRLLSEYLDNMSRLAQLAVAPVVYPVVLICLVLGVFAVSTGFFVPKFLQLYLELGMERSDFPWPTRFASWLSQVMPTVVFFVVVIAIVLIIIYLFYRRSPRMQLDRDIWALWLPVFGRLNRDSATARILGVLGISLDAGMPLDEALAGAGAASGNEMMAVAMRRAAERARCGHSAGSAFEATDILSESILWHLRSAEKSGTLPEACRSLSDYFLSRAELMTRRMAAVLEPLLIILVGLFVGGLGYSMFLPLVNIIGELSS